MMALNRNQREAMLMLQDMRRRYPDEHCDGQACSDSTWYALAIAWPAFINYRTAGALQRRGLVTTEYIGPDEGFEITRALKHMDAALADVIEEITTTEKEKHLMADTTPAEQLARSLDEWLDDEAPLNLRTYQGVADALIKKGWTAPADAAEHKRQAIAYNTTMWSLAVAMGLAKPGEQIVDLDIEQLLADVVTIVQSHTKENH